MQPQNLLQQTLEKISVSLLCILCYMAAELTEIGIMNSITLTIVDLDSDMSLSLCARSQAHNLIKIMNWQIRIKTDYTIQLQMFIGNNKTNKIIQRRGIKWAGQDRRVLSEDERQQKPQKIIN